MTVIRNATTQDVPAMVELGREMHKESQFGQYNFDGDKLSQLMLHLINDESGIAFVAENSGKVVGGFIGLVAEHWFGYDKYSFDFALFMKADHRGGSTGARLLKRYVDQAKLLGANEVLIGNSTGVESARVELLFERMGFIRYGGNYRINVGRG